MALLSVCFFFKLKRRKGGMRNDLLVLLAARLINSTATVVYFTFG